MEIEGKCTDKKERERGKRRKKNERKNVLEQQSHIEGEGEGGGARQYTERGSGVAAFLLVSRGLSFFQSEEGKSKGNKGKSIPEHHGTRGLSWA